MEFDEEMLNEGPMSSLENDLAAIRMNDLHFTEEEKEDAQKRLLKRMTDYDNRRRWHRMAIAAAVAMLLVAGGTVLWMSSHSTRISQETAQLVPRDLDMVLTTTDGHTLNLNEGGQLSCNELGYLTIKGLGQTLKYTPSTGSLTSSGTPELCELRVPEGKHTQIELSDGSRVWVNSGTTIQFPLKFVGSERRIRVDGEVFLEVAHKVGAVFRVETETFCVKVTGTKFGVTSYSGQQYSQVVLAEGRVEVERGDTARYLLNPDQMLTISSGRAQLSEVDTYTYTSWKDGLLYFNGTTLGEALNRLAKHYAVDINCSPGSSQLKLYGKLVLEQRVEDVLNTLTVIEPISYQIRNNQVFVEEKK